MVDNWIDNIDPDDLILEAPALTYLNMNRSATIDDVAQFMVQGGAVIKNYTYETKSERTEEDNRPPKQYWDLVKKEFFLFLCTNDKKYRELRNKLNVSNKQSSTVIVGIVSVFIAKEIGIAAGAITPFCAVCLYGVIKIGVEALCEYIKDQ